MIETEVKEGECAEGMPWKLIIPYESYTIGDLPCRHAVPQGAREAQLRPDGSVWGYQQRFVLSRGIARCLNEAGHNCTELCLECLDEARK